MKIIGNTVGTPISPKAVAEQIDAANALKGKASGEVVRVDDVSPLEHTVAVKAKSKNLFDKDNVEAKKWLNINGQEEATESGYFLSGFISVIPNTTFYIGNRGTTRAKFYDSNKSALTDTWDLTSNGQSFTTPNNCYYLRVSVTAAYLDSMQLELGTAATEYEPYVDVSAVTLQRMGKNLWPHGDVTFETAKTCYLNLPKGTYAISCNITSNSPTNYAMVAYRDNEENYIQLGHFNLTQEGRKTLVFTAKKPLAQLLLYVSTDYTTSIGATASYTDVMVEKGDAATEYRPYIEPTTYPVNADGTVFGVTSLYPTTTLLTNTAGVLIAAEYNKDTNKVIESLVNAIISLGGNV